DGGQYALEALASALAMRRQFGRDDRCGAMDLSAGMARDETDDSLDLVRREPHIGIDTAFSQQVEPQRAVGIDHDLEYARIAERGGDSRPHGGREQGPAAGVG